MSGLKIINTDSRDEVNQASVDFIERCLLILEHVFYQSQDARRAFHMWINNLRISEPHSYMLLHEDPLYISARYVGIDPMQVHSGNYDRDYKILAKQRGWL
jgi:hypothetical protein